MPVAPRGIQKGTPLKYLLNEEAIECLALNIYYAFPSFSVKDFCEDSLNGLENLELMQRGQHIAKNLRNYLPQKYSNAVEVIVDSLTPARLQADQFGLSEFLYLPYSFYLSEYGRDKNFNGGEDPFDKSMEALRELTMRFTSEFAIRNFMIEQQERTLAQVAEWMSDENPHVRRLCSEGTRPKLPWGKRLPALVKEPSPTFFILEGLKNDNSLYVRRSVANHLADVAKNHPEKVFFICKSWLEGEVSKELKWVVRHALRYPSKKGSEKAKSIIAQAK